MSTVGSDGTDGSPRGDDGPVARVVDQKTLLIPDWRGNNRIDSLRNILEDGRISLMFLVGGVRDVVRVNGTAKLTKDKQLCKSFERKGNSPNCVIQISINEVYIHCPKSILRSNLWDVDCSVDLPEIGEILREITQNELGRREFDFDLSELAQKTLW